MSIEPQRLTGHPCYSARLLKPLIDMSAGQLADAVVLRGYDLEPRVPVDVVHGWLTLEVARDEHFGLRAGARMKLGDLGMFDYLLHSAPTVGAALETAAEHFRLVNEAGRLRLEPSDSRVLVRMVSVADTPPVAEAFQLAALYSAHGWLRTIPDLELWFPGPRPRDRRGYTRVFGKTRCYFAAGFSGLSLPRASIDRPLGGADPKLHEILRGFGRRCLAVLPEDAMTVTERVRELLLRDLATPCVSLDWAARRLRVSPSTLGRRLRAERTSFHALLDDVRYDRALQLIQADRYTFSELSRALGFSFQASFCRAFRRWTGSTAGAYRQQLEGGAADPPAEWRELA